MKMQTMALACALLALGACKREDPQAQAAAQAAQLAAREDAANEAAKAFDAAMAAGNWSLAKAQGDVLLAHWPGTEAAKRKPSPRPAPRATTHAWRRCGPTTARR